MPRFSDLQTDSERLAFVKEKLEKDDRWAARGLLLLYSKQTPSEKKKKSTVNINGKGFNSYDAEILTLAAKKLLHNGGDGEHACNSLQAPFSLSAYMSPKLADAVKGKMPKYAAQLLEHSVKSTYPR